MKLDKNAVVQRRLELMEREGIRFVCNAPVGQGFETERLLAEFAALIFYTGATQPRDLAVGGRKLGGVHFAMEYLTASTKRLLIGGDDHGDVSARDRDVVVIGGGDTGTDCMATALRQGCRSLVQFEILPRPPVERDADNPWPEWPKVYRTEYGHEEAAARFSADPRVYVTTVQQFIGDAAARVSALSTVQVAWRANEAGQLAPAPIAGSERTQPAQLVLLALKFTGPEPALLDELGIARDARSNVLADADDYATNVAGTFAACDCRRGQSLVVWAIREGRGTARECDRYLTGRSRRP